MARKSFSVHSDYYGELQYLTAEQRGTLLLALISWASDDIPVELDPMCAMLFRMMTAQIDRISKINSANGSNGGRGNKSEVSEETEKSGESDGEQIKPTISVSLSAPNTASTSTNNMDSEADKDLSANAHDKIEHGEHRLVRLSADEFNELLRVYGDERVDKGINAVDGWAHRNGKVGEGIDWQAQVVDAITKWNISARKRRSTKKNYDDDL